MTQSGACAVTAWLQCPRLPRLAPFEPKHSHRPSPKPVRPSQLPPLGGHRPLTFLILFVVQLEIRNDCITSAWLLAPSCPLGLLWPGPTPQGVASALLSLSSLGSMSVPHPAELHLNLSPPAHLHWLLLTCFPHARGGTAHLPQEQS